jgi:type VI secretion system protein ImpA
LHPLKAHDRKRFLSGLSDGETIYRPLQYLDLTGTTNVTLKTLSDADERPVLIRELGMAAHNRTVFKTYELIKGVQADLTEIRNACLSSETAKCEPDFSLVMKALAAISDAIEEARPDFVAVVSEPDDQSDNLAEVGGSSADIAVGKHPGQLINVNNHDHARALLKACMAYYAHSEPSSPVLLLLIEAERLIGAPLVKAVAALMPQNMETITVRLGDSGFALNASRLAELTKLISEGHEAGTGIQGDTLAGSDAAREAPGTGASSSDPGPVVINTRDNALTAIASVELWFTTVEASSPVPLLLSKAQSYASKNFQSIIADLITNSTETA